MTTRPSHKNDGEKCGANCLKARRTIYPITLGEKIINIQCVSVKKCMTCHHLHPTRAGKEKIERCIMTFMRLWDK